MTLRLSARRSENVGHVRQLVVVDVVQATRKVFRDQRRQGLDATDHRRLGFARVQPLLDQRAHAAPLFGTDPVAEPAVGNDLDPMRSEEHTSELQSLMPNSYAVFCL